MSKPTQLMPSGCGGARPKEEAGVEAPSDLAGLGRPLAPFCATELVGLAMIGSPPRKSSIDRKVEEMGDVSAILTGFALCG